MPSGDGWLAPEGQVCEKACFSPGASHNGSVDSKVALQVECLGDKFLAANYETPETENEYSYPYIATRTARPLNKERSTMRSLIVAIMASLILNSLVVGTASSDDISDLMNDAKTILNAKNGTVKKWLRPPSFVIVYNGNIDKRIFEYTIRNIASDTNFALKPPKYIKVDEDYNSSIGDFRDWFFHTFENAQKEKNLISSQGAGAAIVSGDIFFFILPPLEAATMMVKTSRGFNNFRLQRQYLSGKTPCFYSAASTSKEMLKSIIFINPLVDPATLLACVHEETYQSMGLFNDAPNSDHFSFDNSIEFRDTKNDRILLNSLYSESIVYGSRLQDVLAVLEEKVGDTR